MAVADGFQVDLTALDQAARGVDGVLRQVAGRDLGTVDDVDLGHVRLATAVSGFCDRWAVGVGHLADDVRQISARLDACVAAYHGVDAAVHDRLSGAGPDPGAR